MMRYDGDIFVVTENDLGLSKSTIQEISFPANCKRSLQSPLSVKSIRAFDVAYLEACKPPTHGRSSINGYCE